VRVSNKSVYRLLLLSIERLRFNPVYRLRQRPFPLYLRHAAFLQHLMCS